MIFHFYFCNYRCEFGVMDDPKMWGKLDALNVSIDQIQIEMHLAGVNKKTYTFRPAVSYDVDSLDKMFRELHKQGFVAYHKEVNALAAAHNDCAEYGFVKLDIDCRTKNVKEGQKKSKYLV